MLFINTFASIFMNPVIPKSVINLLIVIMKLKFNDLKKCYILLLTDLNVRETVLVDPIDNSYLMN